MLLALGPRSSNAQTGSVPALIAAPTAAQTAPAYDIVSIKLNKTGSGSWGTDSKEDHYSATNVSLKILLANAYGIREDLISSVPGSIESARFDVEAKIVEPDLPALKKLTEAQQRSMLLPMLAERFQLKAHIETKTLPVYDLVVLRTGPKLKQSTENTHHGGMSSRNRDLTATEVPMVALTSFLSQQLHRTVIDKTGLTAHYDFKLQWSPDDNTDPQETAPPLFTAVQEQLGLKLQSAKGPVETLVVDTASLPSEN